MKISIKAKIFAIIGFLSIIAIIQGIVSLKAITSGAKTADRISAIDIRISDINTSMSYETMNIRRKFNVYMLEPSAENYNSTMESIKKAEKGFKDLKKSFENPDTQEAFTEVHKFMPDYEKITMQYLAYLKREMDLKHSVLEDEQVLLSNGILFNARNKEIQDYVYSQIRKGIRNQNNDIAYDFVEDYSYLTRIAENTTNAIGEIRNAISTNELKGLQNVGEELQKILVESNKLIKVTKDDRAKKEITRAVKDVSSSLEIYKRILKTYEERDRITKERRDFRRTFDEYNDKAFALIQSKMIEEADGAYAFLNASTYVVIVLLLILLGTAVISFVLTVGTVIRPLHKFIETTKDLATGDRNLTIRINEKSGDELGELAKYINTFISSVQGLIVEVKSVADDVASGNNELAATMEELSTTFSTQTEQVDGIVQDMNDMKNISENSMDALNSTMEVVNHTESKGNEGKSQLNNVKDTVVLIRDNTKHLAETIDKLQNSSNQIGEILNVINDIADQTNLLALNAAIEAARAGDAGRGFAVVADEVRKLAERTQHATNEIEEIITSLQSDSIQASNEMNSAGESVKVGVEAIDKTYVGFNEVVDGVDQISETASMLERNIQGQSRAVSQVTERTQEIASGIEESNAAVNEVTLTVEHLQQRTEILKNLVGQFKA